MPLAAPGYTAALRQLACSAGDNCRRATARCMRGGGPCTRTPRPAAGPTLFAAERARQLAAALSKAGFKAKDKFGIYSGAPSTRNPFPTTNDLS